MPTTVSKQFLQGFVYDQGIEVRCPGACYAFPSLAWVTGEFARALRIRQIEDGMARFQQGRNVCTHYTRHAAVVASLCHLNTPVSFELEVAAAKLALGWIDFTRPDGAEHSVNVAVCREGERIFLAYLEPQTRELVSPRWREVSVPFAEI